jgi:thiol:disulfide interchange protein DsbD
MPKPGEWMTLVNAFFGVTMVLIAIWMLERILNSSVTMLAYSFTGIGFAYYLGLFDHERVQHHVKKTIAMIIFVYSVAIFIGVLAGSNSLSNPLKVFSAVNSSGYTSLKSEGVKFEHKVTSITELDALLEQYSGEKILLDFSADWCVACKELEEVTFSDEAVKAKMQEFVLIKADITANGTDEKNLSAKYGIFGPPAIIFFSQNGEVISSKTVVGFIEPDKFLKHLNSI